MANQTAGGPTAMRVWVAAVLTYIVAIAGRTSFGVAGVAASERFEISAAALATFVVVHLAVYALAQVPVGLALDRFGSRALLSVGALLLAAGQLALALAPTYPLALAARVLVGLGDATAFVSVVRLIPAWFPGRRVPLMTQLTAILGQLGPIISAVPFFAILGTFGWALAFGSLAAVGVLVALLAALAIRDAPAGAPPAPDRLAVGATLAAVARHPATWLGFFTHFALLFSPNVFLILWGLPFLTLGQGYSAASAAALISLNSVAGIVAGPVIAALLVRHPLQRALVVLAIIVAVVVGWGSILLPATPRPVAAWALLVVILAFSGAGSSIGFDFARTELPAALYGTASGLVNMGGFVSSIAAIQGIGVVLDALAPGRELGNADFRIAFLVLAPIMVVGVAGILASRRALRARLAAGGVRPLSMPQVVRRILRRG